MSNSFMSIAFLATLIVLGCILIRGSSCCSKDLKLHPTEEKIFRTENENVTFTCTALTSGLYVSWRAKGEQANENTCKWSSFCKIPENQGYTTSTLTIFNLNATEEVTVLCLVGPEWCNRTILVQGTPETISSRECNISYSEIRCLFGQPSNIINGFEVEYVIVMVQGVNDTIYHDTVVPELEIDTGMQSRLAHFNFSFNSSEPEHEYSMEVRPMVRGLKGNASTISFKTFSASSNNCSLDITRKLCYGVWMFQAECHIEGLVPSSLSFLTEEGDLIDWFNITDSNVSNSSTFMHGKAVLTDNSKFNVSAILLKFAMYHHLENLTFQLKLNDTDGVTISTYDVKGVHVFRDDDKVCFKCLYVERSSCVDSPKGCHIEGMAQNGTRLVDQTIRAPVTNVCVSLHGSDKLWYVAAYALSENGDIIYPNPAYVTYNGIENSTENTTAPSTGLLKTYPNFSAISICIFLPIVLAIAVSRNFHHLVLALAS